MYLGLGLGPGPLDRARDRPMQGARRAEARIHEGWVCQWKMQRMPIPKLEREQDADPTYYDLFLSKKFNLNHYNNSTL